MACPTRCTTSGPLDRLARSASLLTWIMPDLSLLTLKLSITIEACLPTPHPCTACFFLNQEKRLATTQALGRLDDPNEDPEILK